MKENFEQKAHYLMNELPIFQNFKISNLGRK
jgi:hypothetical protein